MAGLEGWPWPVWGMSPAALPPCPLCLYWSVCPPLPQRSLLSASALGPEQAGPGMLGPILSASCAQIPLLLCSWTCRPCLAQRPLRLPQPRHMLDAPSHCSGAGGPGWARPPYPRSLVPVHLQQMHSRPTTRSSKSTRPPPRPAQPPLPEVSAGPARSASPARCRAWLRATRRPALPRVSAAVPGLPSPSQQGGCALSQPVSMAATVPVPQRTVCSVWRQLGWAPLASGGWRPGMLLNTVRCPGRPRGEE